MHSERACFNWFHKIIVFEVEESLENEAGETISNNNQMSSRGGEASGAAAPGPGGDGGFGF